MSSSDSCVRSATRDPVLYALAAARRRRVLAVLREASTALPASEVARQVAAAAEPTPGRTSVAGVHRELLHVHLPVLDTSALVSWDRSAGTVSLTDHPLYDHEEVETLLSPDDRREELYDCLADERCRRVVEALEDLDGSIGLADLAAAILAECPPEERDGATLERLCVTLHHVHLPKLADADLLAYDHEDREVVPIDEPRLDLVLEIV